MYTQLSASVADLQTGQSEINSTVLDIDATVTEIDGRVFKMEQNGKIVLNSFAVTSCSVGNRDRSHSLLAVMKGLMLFNFFYFKAL